MATATIDTLAPVRSRQQTWWFPFALLLVGHLPFVFLDLKLTWTRTHYQFFPFALGAFGWMLWQRQNGASKRTKLTRSLLILDVIVLLTGIVINSPWLGSIGMWLVLAAAAVSRRDGQTGSSLAYLALLPRASGWQYRTNLAIPSHGAPPWAEFHVLGLRKCCAQLSRGGKPMPN